MHYASIGLTINKKLLTEIIFCKHYGVTPSSRPKRRDGVALYIPAFLFRSKKRNKKSSTSIAHANKSIY